MAYAENTSVSVSRSKIELDALLQKHGAHQRAFADDDARGFAFVGFTLAGRQYRLHVPLPSRDEFARRMVRGRSEPSTQQRQIADYEQACRARWRAIVLLVKAKLETIALGLSTAEREFLADLVLPDGQRMHAALGQQIAKTYETGGMPKLLGVGGDVDAADDIEDPVR